MPERSSLWRLFRLSVLLAALLYHASWLSAQSERSNQLFSEGVARYEAARYAEAIRFFSQTDSLDRLEMDTTSNRYGYGKQWMAHCYYLLGQTDKAKAISFELHELPPTDRRLTVKSDSLADRLPPLIRNERHDEALALIDAIYAQQQAELGENNLVALETRLQSCYPLAFMGRTSEAVGRLNEVCETAASLLDRKNHYMLHLWREGINLYAMAGQTEQIEASFDRIFTLLTELGDMDSPFAGEMLDVLGGYYAQTRRFPELDQVTQRQLEYIDKSYGAESINRAYFLRSMSELNQKLGRTDVAMPMAEEAARLARAIEGTGGATYILANMTQINCLLSDKQYKEARKLIKRCLKKLRPTDEAYTFAMPGLIHLLFMTQLVEGNIDKELISEAQSQLDRIAEEEGKHSIAYAVCATMLAQAYMVADDPHQGAVLVSEILGTLREQAKPTLLFHACLVLLKDQQYVKARIASSYALERINRQLNQNYVATIATQCRQLADTGLMLVGSIRDEQGLSFLYSARDTTKYSLAMIQQDLLQSKLLTLEKMDSMDTESFWQTLLEHTRTAYLATNDSLMADSLLTRYSRKMQETFGADAPQVARVADIRERCRFEKYGGGWVKAYAISLRQPGSPDYAAQVEEYESAYADWLRAETGGGVSNTSAEPPSTDTIPKMPRLYDTLVDKSFRESLDAFDTAYRYYKGRLEKRNYERHLLRQLLEAAAGWSLCADSLGLREQIAPRLGECWATIREIDSTYCARDLSTSLLAQAWLHCEEADYLALEATVHHGMQDSRRELHAAVMLQTLTWCDEFLWNSNSKETRSRTLQELDSTLHHLLTASAGDKDAARRLFILRCLHLQSYSWRFPGLSLEQLAADFASILDMLREDRQLQAYRECYDAMTYLCDISCDYSQKNSRIAVEADKMRKAIRKKSTGEDAADLLQRTKVDGVYWKTLQHIGKDYNLSIYYTRPDETKEKEEVRSLRLWLAYRECGLEPSGSGQEKYDDVVAKWDEIRGLQRNLFTEDEEIIERIGTLTTLVCQNLECDSSALRGLAYDIALFGKGYLLRSGQQLRKVILQSGNRTVLHRFGEYLKLMQQLDNTSLSADRAEEIRRQAQDIWQELKSSSGIFDDYTKSLEASWKDVQAALHDDEVAIEYIKADDVLGSYYALILRKDWEAPLAVSVGWEKHILQLKDSIYEKDTYSSLIPEYIFRNNGETIRPLEGIRTIYFSPTGLLHHVALESLYCYGTDSLMSEKYNMYRVSSTRNLIGRRHEGSQDNEQEAVLYGGITYDLEDDAWAELASKATTSALPAQRDIPRLQRGAVETALAPLKGSREEVQQITSILSRETVPARCITGQSATEDHLKGLSGTKATILHIATHGFSQTAEDVADSTALGFSRAEDTREENALSRAGLFMAGASAVFYGTAIPDNVEDGVLTAREISHLDFTNLQLVVLSACESGLGDVTADGVFGLQRGFKKAGAGSILMSLWNVDDEATSLLMREFYKNWIGGRQSKYAALEQAKHAVRSHTEKGWDDPKFWAAFILLDAIDNTY